MQTKICLAALIAVVALLSAQPMRADSAAEAQIQRGKYLVEQVALCGDCHSPRDDKGQFIRADWLQGEVINFKPTQTMPWAPIAPGIAGLPSFKLDEQAVKLLETGTNVAGRLSLPPMPQFRFRHEDAEAVVAYLRSLKK